MTVFKLMLDGHSKADILEALPTLCPQADAHSVIADAVDSFAVIASEPRDSVLGWCLESARVLYRKSVEVSDFTAALACVKEVARLINLKNA